MRALQKVLMKDPKYIFSAMASQPAEAGLQFRDEILGTLQISKSSGLTPGGIRGGGCVHAYQARVSLPTLLWHMMIKHLQT